MGIITTQKLVDYEAVLMNPAYVHINKKSVETVEEYKEILEKNDIYSIGRYGSWTYCSIEDNILEARELSGLMSCSVCWNGETRWWGWIISTIIMRWS